MNVHSSQLLCVKLSKLLSSKLLLDKFSLLTWQHGIPLMYKKVFLKLCTLDFISFSHIRA